jgi:2'-5' RNA ligase
MRIIAFLLLIIANHSFANNDIKQYKIAIIPEQKCIDKAEKISKKIATYLDDNNSSIENSFYVSLYTGSYHEQDVITLLKQLYSLELKKFYLKFTTIYSENDSSIKWKANPNAKLIELQKSTTILADQLNQKKIEIDYIPYMSLFHVKNSNLKLQKIVENFIAEKMNCQIKELIVGQEGEFGQLINQIYSYKAD